MNIIYITFFQRQRVEAANPEFPTGLGPTPNVVAPTYYFGYFFEKLHENETVWILKGVGDASLAPIGSSQ